MEQFAENAEDKREEIKSKLRQCFDGKIVRKDLTKKIKEGANVPVYVLEFLLGQYCSSDDEETIEKGVNNVKKILADNFVRPDEAQKILSKLRAKGNYTVIDKVTFLILVLLVFRLMTHTRRSLTGCFAVVSGVLFSSNMSLKQRWKRI